MTAPDHRPYLLPTDLRTAEDVARWLRTYHPCEQLGDAVDDLRARLDRERRQACRRGALSCWRAFRFYASTWGEDLEATGVAPMFLVDALAFRAAARAKP